jgi:hypothetical protein
MGSRVAASTLARLSLLSCGFRKRRTPHTDAHLVTTITEVNGPVSAAGAVLLPE